MLKDSMPDITSIIIGKVAETATKTGLSKVGNWFKTLFKPTPPTIDELKRNTHILFVDDEDFSPRLETLRNAGWSVSQVTDITNYNAEEIRNADVIFMDYINVGKTLTPSQQGIGLLKGLNQRYPNKFLIFYSGHAGFIPGHEVHTVANAWIDKHADPYVYIDQIEAAAASVYGKRKG